jgi:hypothetical protein
MKDLRCALFCFCVLVVWVGADEVIGGDGVGPLRMGRSVLGDPGMRSEKVRVAVEGWNFCNRVGYEAAGAPSPRWADCTDIDCKSDGVRCSTEHRVVDLDNDLRTGEAFPRGSFETSNDADLYVVEKEKYLAALCEEDASAKPWHFWMLMLKNGNYDQSSNLCRNFAEASKPLKFLNPRTGSQLGAFPCFGPGCMNQPVVLQNLSKIQPGDGSHPSLSGSVYGTYDVDQAGELPNANGNISYFSVTWEKNATSGSWIFTHKLTVSQKYPWLMLYLRADATSGVSGGYPWETRGMMRQVRCCSLQCGFQQMLKQVEEGVGVNPGDLLCRCLSRRTSRLW